MTPCVTVLLLLKPLPVLVNGVTPITPLAGPMEIVGFTLDGAVTVYVSGAVVMFSFVSV
jgi:hypothetical protein